MSLISWIALGLVTGLVASHLVNRRDPRPAAEVTLVVVGALVAGGVAHAFGASSGVSAASLICALLGACVVLAVYHGLTRGLTRRTAWDRPGAAFVKFRGGYGRRWELLTPPPVWRQASPVTIKIRMRPRR